MADQPTSTPLSPLSSAPPPRSLRTRRNEHEARAVYSLWSAAAGALGVLAILGVFLRNFQWGEAELKLGAGRPAFYAYLGGVALAGMAGVIGLILGFQSAGQKRNSLNGLAWTGFFLNAGIVTIAGCAALVFWFLKEIVVMR